MTIITYLVKTFRDYTWCNRKPLLYNIIYSTALLNVQQFETQFPLKECGLRERDSKTNQSEFFLCDKLLKSCINYG